jgi:hypothetical protein
MENFHPIKKFMGSLSVAKGRQKLPVVTEIPATLFEIITLSPLTVLLYGTYVSRDNIPCMYDGDTEHVIILLQ